MDTEIAQSAPGYRRNLGDGLILRWSTRADADDIIRLPGIVFRDSPEDPPNSRLENLMRVLMDGQHPLMGPGDVAVVEDTGRKSQRLVAMTCLWRQPWSYDGIPLMMGRPEIVAADPEYRNRGLVRAVFGLVHARSKVEGHLVQAITGIPYFYRQFGYEYALDLDMRRDTYTTFIPKAQEGESEPYRLRDATSDDISAIAALYERRCASSLVSTLVDTRWWHEQIAHWNTFQADCYWHVCVITNEQGTFQGYVILPALRRETSIPVFDLAVIEGVNLMEVTPSVLRAIQAEGERLLKPYHVKPIAKITFMMESDHPLYSILPPEMVICRDPPYAWYVRVPDLPAFIRHIEPVLERRLAQSELSGYSGELALNFYRGGLRMVFAHGRLETVENWQSPHLPMRSSENAGFPPLVFLQLLFGRRSLEDLRYAFPDVWASEKTTVVLNTLFPKRMSWTIPLG